MVANFYVEDIKLDAVIAEFEQNGKRYTLSREKAATPGILFLTDETGSELMRIDMKDVFNHFDTSQGGSYQISKDFMSAAEATFTQENDKAVISLVAVFVAIERSGLAPMYNGDFYVLIHIK